MRIGRRSRLVRSLEDFATAASGSIAMTSFSTSSLASRSAVDFRG